MEASKTQALRKQTAAAKTQPATLSEHVLSLVALPAREELARAVNERADEPRLLTAQERASFAVSEKKLKKTLAEIDYRLSIHADPLSPENLPHKLKEAGRLRPGEGTRVNLTLVTATPCFVLGALVCLGLRISPNVGLPLVLAGATAAAVVSNLVLTMGTAFKQLSAADNLVFNSEGSPSTRVLRGLNPLVHLKGLFYRGPSSDAAREFDRELEALEKKTGSSEYDSRFVIAKEGLAFEKKQVAAELALVSKRLTADEGVREGLKMIERLTAGLAIPESADSVFLKETACATEALLKSLAEYMKDRLFQIPGNMYELTYFKQIISHLEKNQVDEAVVRWFFDRFQRALEKRLEQTQGASGKVKVPDAQTVIP